MSASWSAASLLEPVSPEEPCGKSLEDTDALALNALEAYQIFGQTTLEPEVRKPGDPVRRESRKSDRPPNWDEIRDISTELLAKSKDLRVLAHLGAAVLRIEGIRAFGETLAVASHWLVTYWSQAYPPLDEEGISRRSALNYFADPVAVVDGLRKAPLVSSRQHGRFSLRDLDIASGVANIPGQEPRPEDVQIASAFAGMAFADLKALQESALAALTALKTIDETMRREVGIEGAPSFDALVAQYQKMGAALRARLAAHPEAQEAAAAAGAAAEGAAAGVMAPGVIAVGSIRSRQDAIRALDAAAEFFRQNEPSSPVPMFVERAKRLIAKDFLQVLADVAPDAVGQAKAAGGIRD